MTKEQKRKMDAPIETQDRRRPTTQLLGMSLNQAELFIVRRALEVAVRQDRASLARLRKRNRFGSGPDGPLAITIADEGRLWLRINELLEPLEEDDDRE